jgi:hypothetical protein
MKLTVGSSEPESRRLVSASDLMRPAAPIDVDDDLELALHTMISNGLSQVPTGGEGAAWRQ